MPVSDKEVEKPNLINQMKIKKEKGKISRKNTNETHSKLSITILYIVYQT